MRVTNLQDLKEYEITLLTREVKSWYICTYSGNLTFKLAHYFNLMETVKKRQINPLLHNYMSNNNPKHPFLLLYVQKIFVYSYNEYTKKFEQDFSIMRNLGPERIQGSPPSPPHQKFIG